MSAKNEMVVVLVGTPLDGYEVVGPFPGADEATAWAKLKEPR